MLVLALALSLVIGFVVAAGAVGREARRLGLQRREPVWRLEEAAGFVGEELPLDAAASLDPETLRQLLRWHLNQLQFARTGEEDADLSGPEVSDDHRSTSELYRQARQVGVEVTRPVVDAVVTAHLRYLARIGALGEADAG